VGETRVDLLHLLEDLRDAYVGPIEETLLTEITANALDSGATDIQFVIDPVGATLTIVDNGAGMRRRDLARYHDVAASTKRRGEGIGFAGVGIKLGLLACREVVTETRRGSTHVATTWRLASKHRAPWRWTPPEGLVSYRGTAVRLGLANVLSPLLDPAYVELTLKRHFAAVLAERFERLLAEHGRPRVALSVNGRALRAGSDGGGLVVPIEIRLPRKRKPAAVGFLERRPTPFPEDEHGVAISTLGKVIKRGWDWLGLTPEAGELVSGLVEVPPLAAALTLNKADFIRTGTGGALYLSYRKALQEVVARRLAEWGDLRRSETDRPPATIGLREFEDVLQSLASQFPMLGSLVDRRRGGQTPLPISTGDMPGGLATATDRADSDLPERTEETGPGQIGGDEPRPEPDAVQLPDQTPAQKPFGPGGVGRLRPRRFGLRISFERRPEDQEVARLVESTVAVNTAHPAYGRAVATRAVGYHVALSVALALAPVAVEAADQHAFLTSFLAGWGNVLMTSRGAHRRPKRRKPRRDKS
jgi:hypothetical protein